MCIKIEGHLTQSKDRSYEDIEHITWTLEMDVSCVAKIKTTEYQDNDDKNRNSTRLSHQSLIFPDEMVSKLVISSMSL